MLFFQKAIQVWVYILQLAFQNLFLIFGSIGIIDLFLGNSYFSLQNNFTIWKFSTILQLSKKQGVLSIFFRPLNKLLRPNFQWHFDPYLYLKKVFETYLSSIRNIFFERCTHLPFRLISSALMTSGSLKPKWNQRPIQFRDSSQACVVEQPGIVKMAWEETIFNINYAFKKVIKF